MSCWASVIFLITREDIRVKMKPDLRDLTQGSLAKKILWFSIPLIISNLLQVLFNMADIAVVGQFAGANALGSVGSTTTLVTMFTGFLIGMSGGINVLVALHYGRKDREGLSQTIHSALIVSAIAGLILMLFGIGFSEGILRILNTKEELLNDAVLYVRIYCIGLPAMAVYNFGNAVFSAVGDTKRPLYYLSIAGILNLALNIFLVIVCGMDVAGVAIATAVSQYLAATLILVRLFRSSEAYALRFTKLRLNSNKAIAIIKIGLPGGMQNAIFQIANLFIQVGVNTFNATMVAGNAAAANADALVFDVMVAFYTACGSFMGQNYGAGNKRRTLESYFVSLAYSFGISLLMGAALVCFGTSFLGLFTSETVVIEAGMHRLTIMGFSYCVSAFMDCTIAASRALGKSIVPTIIVLLGSCVFRIIWVYTIFAYFQTISSLYLLYVFSWILTAIAEIIYFAYAYRKLNIYQVTY